MPRKGTRADSSAVSVIFPSLLPFSRYLHTRGQTEGRKQYFPAYYILDAKLPVDFHTSVLAYSLSS